QAITTSSPRLAPQAWASAVKACLTNSDGPVLASAVAAARALSTGRTNGPNFSDALLRIAREEKHPVNLRLEAMAAVPGGLRSIEPDLFTFLCANVDPSKPVPNRNAAVTVLAKA